jgi:RimJ/RimL family protein N-acetyltransferase
MMDNMYDDSIIQIRLLERNDLEEQSKWPDGHNSIWHFYQTFYHSLPKTKEKRGELFKQIFKWRKLKEPRLEFSIINNEQLIGRFYLRDISDIKRKAWFGIYLRPDYVNKGYGSKAINMALSYAFSNLDLEQVWLRVPKFNKFAIRAYEKNGFQIHRSTMRQVNKGIFEDDKFIDIREYCHKEGNYENVEFIEMVAFSNGFEIIN